MLPMHRKLEIPIPVLLNTFVLRLLHQTIYGEAVPYSEITGLTY
jgi:hypothetical protein